MVAKDEDTSVRVALRIRPQVPREKIELCQICTAVYPDTPTQVVLGSDRAFTYDHVFDTTSHQSQLFDSCVEKLVDGCFDGYNATVLAYGQTGSGKTYTMGTGFDPDIDDDIKGIIPRAVAHLFAGMNARMAENNCNFNISVQFVELYNEEILDLLDPDRDVEEKKSNIRIHEDPNGGIYLMGVNSKTVKTERETMECLSSGALGRTTGSTNMNAQSSRSHAIFSIHVQTSRMSAAAQLEGDAKPSSEDLELLSAKFHFVDLAGSERLKRTGATGDRAKEGISINCGLLALGNVISALGDQTKVGSHVPYRDSKLTRLLQDSLGGNSRTLMIACVSPSDCDFVETLNTLKYANRARNIKNKVMVNQDKTSRIIGQLRAEIAALQLQVNGCRQGGYIGGDTAVNDLRDENALLQGELAQLRLRVKSLHETVDTMSARNAQLSTQCELAGIRKEADEGAEDEADPVGAAIGKYMTEIENMRTRLCESEATCEALRKQVSQKQQLLQSRAAAPVYMSPLPDGGTPTRRPGLHGTVSTPVFDDFSDEEDISEGTDVVSEARDNLEKLKAKASALESPRKMVSSTITNAEGEDAGQEMEDDDDEDEDEENNDPDYEQQLADIQTEISIKERLIDELEQSRKRLARTRAEYEQRLTLLQQRILATEQERDKMLNDMSARGSTAATEAKVKAAKEDYERRLARMRADLAALKAMQKKHAQVERQQAQQQARLQQLQNQLADMKRVKVQLMQKMKDEGDRLRRERQTHTKEVTQLKKEARQKETKIKKLELESERRENVLKRRQEEVMALRQAQRINRGGSANKRTPTDILKALDDRERLRNFSPKVARNKWSQLEKMILSTVNRRQTLARMEIELERHLARRDKLRHKLAALSAQKEQTMSASVDKVERESIVEEIETVKANMDYVNRQLRSCQQEMVEVAERNDENEAPQDAGEDERNREAETVLAQVSNIGEAKYLLQRLLTACIAAGYRATASEASEREASERLSQLQTDSNIQQQLLSHVIAGDSSPPGITDVTMSSSTESSGSGEPSTSARGTGVKQRKRTPTAEDLLYAPSDSVGASGLPPLHEKSAERNVTPHPTGKKSSSPDSGVSSDTALMPPPASLPPKRPAAGASGAAKRQVKPPAAPAITSTSGLPSVGSMGVRQRSFNVTAPSSEGVTRRPQSARVVLDIVGADGGEFQRNKLRSTVASTSNLHHHHTPSPSPTFSRRRQLSSSSAAGDTAAAGGGNVFARLAGTQAQARSPSSSSAWQTGTIQAFESRDPGLRDMLLSCMFVARSGHQRSILCVDAAPGVFVTGSKDRHCKLWSVTAGREVCRVGVRHPNNVISVRFLPDDPRMILTASFSEVRLYDTREAPTATCVHAFNSSGLGIDGKDVPPDCPQRQFELEKGGSKVTDIAVCKQQLIVAASQVRVWDLRTNRCTSKLNTGVSPVECLTIANRLNSNGQVLTVTGAKDHRVKLFQVPTNGDTASNPILVGQSLNPPHIDGVATLAICPDQRFLFSGSRNAQIKKWRLEDGMEMQTVNNAHSSRLHGLLVLPCNKASGVDSVLVSAGDGGRLHLWQHESGLRLLGGIHAHTQDVSQMATDGKLLFTASCDGTVGIWAPRSDQISELMLGNENE